MCVCVCVCVSVFLGGIYIVMYNACVCCKAHVKHINVSLLRTSIGVCIFPTHTTTVYV